ncbi:MAG: hypothetical protein JWM91_1494 [Rhodospirillales bacterium]|nr:hypothetical protein [Rhodospirillales bacterium]
MVFVSHFLAINAAYGVAPDIEDLVCFRPTIDLAQRSPPLGGSALVARGAEEPTRGL